MFLAGLVVVLLSLAGLPAHTTVLDRSLDTAVGGAVALLAALLWPNWERQPVPDRLADLVEAYRRYLQSMIDPDSSPPGSGQRPAAGPGWPARRPRPRWTGPGPNRLTRWAWSIWVRRCWRTRHRLVHALTALDATRQSREIYQKVPEFRFLIDAALRGMGQVQQSVQHGWRHVRDLKLRSLQADLVLALRQAELAPEVGAALIEATDRLVNSLNSIAAVLAQRGAALAARAAEQSGSQPGR